MNKKILIGLIILIAVAGVGYRYWTGTVEYSLLQIKSAVDTHNVPQFKKFVDVETLVSRAVDTVMENGLGDSGGDDMEAMGATMAAGMVAMMKPNVVEYANNQIIKAVEGDNNKVSSVSSIKGIRKPLSGLESFFDSNYANLKESYLKKETNIAFLGLSRFDEKLKDTITLELKLRNMDGYWQLVEISNLKEMMSRKKELEAKRLDELNAPIIARLDKAVTLSVVYKKDDNSNKWDSKVIVAAFVDNNTGQTLKDVLIALDILDDKDIVLTTLDLSIPELQAAEKQQFSWVYDINQFIEEDKILQSIPDGDLKYEAYVISFTTAAGEEVMILNSI